MVIFALVIILALLLEWQSLQQPYDRLQYECLPDRQLVEPDEAFQLITHLDNLGYMPVAFIKMQENLPQEIILEDKSQNVELANGFLYLTSTHFLWPRKRLTRKVTASLPKRGRYLFNGATLFLGDLLGFRETGQSYQQIQEIVVFPKPLPAPELSQALGKYLGDLSINRFILEDPMLTVGFQEYTGHEPQKSISWPQSLRAGKLMVKKYDHTLDLSVKIVLNTAYPVNRHKNFSHIETCFSLARSICEELEKKGIQYGLLTNAKTAGGLYSGSAADEGLGNQHLHLLLETLGRATYDSTCSYAELLAKAQKQSLPCQATIIITAYQPPEIRPELDRLQAVTGTSPYIIEAKDYCTEDDRHDTDSD